jgi:hypothetical protein
MSDTELLLKPEAVNGSGSVQRVEVFTGTGRRRRWTAEQKAAIVAETYERGETVSAVARARPDDAAIVHLAARCAASPSQRKPDGVCAGGFGTIATACGRCPDRAEPLREFIGNRDQDRGCDGSRSGWDRACNSAACSACAHDGGGMITVPSGVRVLVATRPVDFRKGGEGLAALVREALGEDPIGDDLRVPQQTRRSG